MSEVRYRSDVKVELVQSVGGDREIARAAWVLSPGAEDPRDNPDGWGRVIGAMMRGRHGTPFEHGSMTVHVEAPIFVFREWMRHRIGWGFNETSARYSHLEPEFWMPKPDRLLAEPDGFKPMRPEHVEADAWQRCVVGRALRQGYCESFAHYRMMLDNNIAREVARSILPVGIYSRMHATCNPRSLMSFLSLRTRDERASVPSYPQAEIGDAARQLETLFAERWPITHAMFNYHGRQGP